MNGWKKKFARQQPMTPERRKTVVISALVAIMGGVMPLLAHGHLYLTIGIIVIMLVGLAYAGYLIGRFTCSED